MHEEWKAWSWCFLKMSGGIWLIRTKWRITFAHGNHLKLLWVIGRLKKEGGWWSFVSAPSSQMPLLIRTVEFSNCHVSLILGYFPINQLWRSLFRWWIGFSKYNAECPIWGFTFPTQETCSRLGGFWSMTLCCSTGLYQCAFLTKFLQVFDIWHTKTRTKIKCTSIDMRNLGFDMYVVWFVKNKTISQLTL